MTKVEDRIDASPMEMTNLIKIEMERNSSVP